MLTFSDQQVITGIAILISGYSQLRGGLAVYYWKLTVDLAWFSSIAHLTTLTCLRHYFQERQGLKILRLICMAVMAGMLSCALASTGYSGLFSYDYPAWCLFHRKLLRNAYPEDDDGIVYNTNYIVLVLLFLFVSYGARVIQLFPSGLDRLRRNAHTRLGTFARSRLLKYKNRALGISFRTYWALVYTLTMAIYCIFKAAADLIARCFGRSVQLLQSPLDGTHTDCLNPKITWLTTALVWGSIRMIMNRNFDHQAFDPGSLLENDLNNAVLEDDAWGFG